MRRKLWVIVIGIMLAFPSFGKPAVVAEYIKAKEPYGAAALYKKMVFHVYSAQFWTDAKGWQQDKPYALHLNYYVTISKQALLKRTLKELRRNPSVTEDMLAEYERKLGFLFPDVADGDSITATHVPGEGVLFCHNDNKLGWIKEPALITPFFGIWLGEYTSEPALRKSLLRL